MFEKFSWWFVNDRKHEIKYPWLANTNKKNAIIFKTIQKSATETRHDRIEKKWLNYKNIIKLWNIKIKLT